MPRTREIAVGKKVSATAFREHLRECLRAARKEQVVLIENRRQQAKYLVDKNWLDELLRERESILATLEILLDRELTERLLNTARTIDEDIQAGRLRTMEEVFG